MRFIEVADEGRKSFKKKSFSVFSFGFQPTVSQNLIFGKKKIWSACRALLKNTVFIHGCTLLQMNIRAVDGLMVYSSLSEVQLGINVYFPLNRPSLNTHWPSLRLDSHITVTQMPFNSTHIIHVLLHRKLLLKGKKY